MVKDNYIHVTARQLLKKLEWKHQDENVTRMPTLYL